jgi:hypothetical protein
MHEHDQYAAEHGTRRNFGLTGSPLLMFAFLGIDVMLM